MPKPAQKKTRLLSPGVRAIRDCAALLQSGGLVALPSETVYGLAAHGLSPEACTRIFEAKGRPQTDPLILHVNSLDQAESLAHFTPAARRLAAAFWPGPLTLVLRRRACVPDIVTSGRATVAIRMPAHPLFREVLRTSGVPLAAPSANPFGGVSPTTALHVLEGLGGRIDAVLDGGACPVGVESTIVDISRVDRPRLLRPGGIPAEEIEQVLGKPLARTVRTTSTGRAAAAPGMLDSHYSPRAKTTLVHHGDLASALSAAGPHAVFLRFGKETPLPRGFSRRGITLPRTDMKAARGLFAALRDLDARSPSMILIEAPDARHANNGLWPAIVDRIRRASAPKHTAH
jgi:L-threonylcarbamoyladenylate synthase